MALFKKKQKEQVGQIKLQELSTRPHEQLTLLQRRLDHLQSSNIQLSTHVGELKINADGEITRIQMSMDKIKYEMAEVKEHLTHVSDNLSFVVSDLNLTAKSEDMEKFSQDLDRFKPFGFITRSQFEKILKDRLDRDMKQLQ